MRTGGNLWLQDIRKSEIVVGIAKTTGIFLLMLYIFYESLLPGAVLFPIWFLYFREWLKDLSRKKEQEFRIQFRDSIQAMSTALKAGCSVEHAIREAGKDLSALYGKGTRIRREYERMSHQLDLKMAAGGVLEDFAERTGLEDVENFVRVFASAKKSGGDSIAIIRNAVRIISGKIDTEKEIQTLLASKKLEFEIMCAVPFVIILYMKLTFGEFLSVLYDSTAGTVVMSVCLAVYLAAYQLGRKITSIEV